MTRIVNRREHVNHIRALSDIPIDEGSEDEFELVSEGNYDWSYDTTGNNTISYLIRVSMKIVKLTVTLKNERVIEMEKKTMFSILRFEIKSLRLLIKLKLLV